MSQDVSAPAARRGQQNAVANVRQRLVEVRSAVGTAHPDYASALIQLALLLIMHGDPNEAEPLLREALDIRRATLGERHPDYATCLSSLAGLLWARGDLDAAEPLLRQALAIRCEILGERHPKSIVSQNSLDQLLQAKKAWDSAANLDTSDQAPAAAAPVAAQTPPVVQAAREAEAPVAPAPPPEPVAAAKAEPAPEPERVAPPAPPEKPAPPVAPEPAEAAVTMGGRSREELFEAIEALADQFADLGGALHGAVGRLKDQGALPADTLIDALRDSRALFASLKSDVYQLAAGLGMADANSRPAESLHDLSQLVSELERHELERSRSGQARRAALGALDRVARLVYADPRDFPPLRECQDAARRLHQAIEGSSPAELPDEAFALADGMHPYNALLALADSEGSLNDDDWANALELVQSHLGKPLSVAVARAKIVAGSAA